MTRPAALHCALLVSLFAAACGDGSPPAATVTDSAGVRIATSAPTSHVYATVDSVPTLSIGGPDATGPSQFFNIQGVWIDPADRLWVANRSSNEVRVFDSDGAHWKSFGGSGDGPGEFRRIRLLGASGEDRVAVWDDESARLTLLTLDAELADLVVLRVEEAAPRAYDVFPDGSLLLREQRVIQASAISPGTTFQDTMSLYAFDYAQNRATKLGGFPGVLWHWTGRAQVPIPFTTSPDLDIDASGALHVAAGSDFRIRVVRDGGIVESYGVDRLARDVTDDDVAAYRDFYAENLGAGETRTAYLSVIDHRQRPETLPAYDRIVVAADGNVWARIYSPDLLAAADWHVYAPDRRLLGTARTPAGLIVEAIGADRLVGVWRDEEGVEHLRAYRYTTSGPG